MIILLILTLFCCIIEPRPIPQAIEKQVESESKCILKKFYENDHTRPKLSKVNPCDGDEIK